MDLTSKGSHTLTPFSSCDIEFISNGEVMAWIGSITWTKENWIKGQLYFSSFNEDVEWGSTQISIRMKTESGELLEYIMDNAIIIFNPDVDLVGEVHSFEANSIRRMS